MTAGQPDPRLTPGLTAWLDAHAGGLDDGSHDAAEVLPRLAVAGVFRLGVPAAQGGTPGTDIGDAIMAPIGCWTAACRG